MMKNRWRPCLAGPAYVYALDIGSKKVAMAAAKRPAAGPAQELVIETVPAKGIFKGVVNDLAALSDAVAQVTDRMEARTGNKVTQVSLSINGNYIACRRSRVAMALSDRGTRSITRRDLAYLSEQARLLGTELDEYLIAEIPQGFSIDRHPMTRRPLGLHGRRLETEVLVVTAPYAHVSNIVKAVERVGVDVAEVRAASLAAAEAVLGPEERQRGVVLIDIGDTLTGVVVLREDRPTHVRVLPFGGRNLVEIIANYCHVTMEVAEGIARNALEIGAEPQESDAVMIRAEGMFRPVAKRDLVGAVVSEMERFVSLLHDAVAESLAATRPGMSVVATGGLSLVEGLLEKLEQDLALPVRLGVPRGTAHMPVSQSITCAAAAGLAQRCLSAAGETPFLLQEPGNKVARFVDSIRHLYQDYF